MTGGLSTTLIGTLSQRDKLDTDVKIVMTWALANPAEIRLDTFYVGDPNPTTWHVARTAFVAAMQTFARGSWVGVGAFSMCFDGTLVTLAFHPVWAANTTATVVLLGEQVARFIAHADLIVPAASRLEEAINLNLVDQAIAKILA